MEAIATEIGLKVVITLARKCYKFFKENGNKGYARVRFRLPLFICQSIKQIQDDAEDLYYLVQSDPNWFKNEGQLYEDTRIFLEAEKELMEPLCVESHGPFVQLKVKLRRISTIKRLKKMHEQYLDSLKPRLNVRKGDKSSLIQNQEARLLFTIHGFGVRNFEKVSSFVAS